MMHGRSFRQHLGTLQFLPFVLLDLNAKVHFNIDTIIACCRAGNKKARNEAETDLLRSLLSPNVRGPFLKLWLRVFSSRVKGLGEERRKCKGKAKR